MATTVDERFGRRLSDRQSERGYIVRGTEDAGDARDAVLAVAPATWEGHALDDVQVDEIEGVAGGGYYAIARYVAPSFQTSEPEDGDQDFSFDTAGGTERITQSLATTHYPDAAETPRFGGAIGVSERGVEGVEIVAPAFSFAITFTKATLTSDFVDRLYRATGRVNSDDVVLTVDTGLTKAFAAGELLCTRVDGSKRGGGPWQITASFSARPNETDLAVGSITGIEKKGHEYLWVLYDDAVDASRLVKTPRQVYVEQVYKTAPFAGLFGTEQEPDPFA